MYVPDIHGRGSVFPDPRSEGFGAARRVLEFPVPNIPLNDSISTEKHLHLFTWLLKSISIAISGDATPFSAALFPSTSGNSSLGKRSASPNTTTSVVAGILVTVFVLLAGAFLYVYRRSVRFRKQARKRRRHRHKRRASKNSQASETVGGGGDGGGDAAADAGAQA
ncbi:hypothetical protein GGR51DRAFT_33501 [Nemania sp. FL0031]|nr:hypothetical protein GGR51DRAFT_33501 [Nemania sp. FL0031]